MNLIQKICLLIIILFAGILINGFALGITDAISFKGLFIPLFVVSICGFFIFKD